LNSSSRMAQSEDEEAKVEAPTTTTTPEPTTPEKGQQVPSRRCRHWARGVCKRGDSCSFLHTGTAGVHVPCRHFVRTGSCSRGNLCDFKHDASLAFGVGFSVGRMMIPVRVMTPPPPQQPHAFPLLPFPPPLHHPIPFPMNTFQARANGVPTTLPRSTNPCRHWQNGLCRLGQSCGFAHDPTVPQKFRTTPCRHWVKGACRLGEACGFAHPSTVPQLAEP
jgi:hypothetical protein